MVLAMFQVLRCVIVLALLGHLQAFTLPDPVAPVWTGSSADTVLDKRNEGESANAGALTSFFDSTNLQKTQVTVDQFGNPIQSQVQADGVAITASTITPGAVSSGSARWVYNHASRTGAADLPAVSESSAFLVPLNAGGQYPVTIDLITDAHWYGKAELRFRVWDGTTVGSEFTSFDTQSGANTVFSSTLQTMVVEVFPINQAPTGTPTTTELTAWSVGSTQARITVVGTLATGLTDIDYPASSASSGLGLAITAVDQNFSGTLDYSLDGIAYQPFPALTSNEVLCLPPTARIRSNPATPPGSAGTGDNAFAAVVWDGTNTAIGGGATGDYQLTEALTLYEDRFTESGVQSQSSLSDVSALSDTSAVFLYSQPVAANTAPAFTVLPTTSGTIGQAYLGDVTATDADNDAITLSLVSGPNGLSLNDLGGGQGEISGTPTANGSLVLRATDARGAATDTTVVLNLQTNAVPLFTVLPTTSGTIGQAYLGDVTATDADNDAITLSLVSGPAGLSLTDLGGGQGRISGTPTANGSLVLRAQDARGATTDTTVVLNLAAAAATAAAVDFEPLTITPASARRPRYYAIAPNSRSGLTSLRERLADLGPRRARGFWWDGSYQELTVTAPPDSRQPFVGLFVATARDLDLPTSAPALTMPFAITLNPGWNFIGVPPAWNGSTAAVRHAWSDFGLSTSDGTIITSDGVMLGTLAASGAASIPGPYAYDPDAGYVRTTTLLSGRGYWLRNYGTTAVNLVRVDASDARRRVSAASAPVSLIARSAAAAPAAATPDELPPAPPASADLEAGDGADGGGACGSGIAAILLGLPLLLRRRARRG
jgi:hypothetical protein